MTSSEDSKSSQPLLAKSCDHVGRRLSSSDDLGSTGESKLQPQHVAIPARVQLGQLSDAESWDLSGKFAAMLSKLIPLMEKALSLETFKQFLQHFCDVRTGQPYIEPAIYQHCSSTREILNALLHQYRFHPIQLSLLNMIVEEYGCDECKKLLRDYESKIPTDAPLKRSHNELSDEEMESSLGTKKLKVTISGEPDTCSLEVVERTKVALVRSSGVDGSAMVYGNHTPGSVVLNFIIPVCTVESFANIDKSKKRLSILDAVGVLSLAIDHIVIDIKVQVIAYQTDLTPIVHTTIPAERIHESHTQEHLLETLCSPLERTTSMNSADWGYATDKGSAVSQDVYDRKPTLKELQKFVVTHASEIWEDLGIELELDDDGTTLDRIQQERGENASKCCLDVVKTWLQGAGVHPKTWRVLLGCLRAIGADAAIASIQENILTGMNSTLVRLEVRREVFDLLPCCKNPTSSPTLALAPPFLAEKLDG